MTISKLASEIAKREGKKSQARIGDIREILGVLTDIFHEQQPMEFGLTLAVLVQAGARRNKGRKK